MEFQEIELKIKELESLFESGREKCYSLRKVLALLSAPAPSGESELPRHSTLLDVLQKRQEYFEAMRVIK